ncbi:MAG: DUF1844 domain-containing protein [Thermoanaerobaculia bacterium]|nr:DUF1844 domain-containing protein [Thermoanaerobaculia bacterium]
MSERDIKVTDKRMFTPDGRLREDYEHLEREEGTAPAPTPSAEETPAEKSPEAPPPPREAAPPQPEAPPPLEIPSTPDELGAPGFLDLLAVLAEPVPLYLGDARLPDGRSLEDLRAARFHIDLLDVLTRKTAGNLTAEEAQVLEQTLYQLRMRYVQKRG